MIIGTAGHIDHGKTSLVRALTGIETDRLKEEKARGISIDLGFAYWPQPDGRVIGFVDVPGHEALVHNMLAGATGIDTVLLVVAADDGVMPQTREHLAILDLLGLSRGIVALNKCDRVDSARLAAVTEDVRAALRGTGLATAPILPVSALTGAGLDVLKAEIDAQGSQSRTSAREKLFRLAIDRVFTLKGHGTAVTGTVLSGQVAINDEVVITPLGRSVRVRSINAQNAPVQVGEAGQRCALVLTGIDKESVRRGDMVVAAELHAPTTRIDVSLRILATEPKPIGSWFPVKVHHGASEVPARLVPLDHDKLAPGESGFVQVVFERPLAACNGDRFVLRDTTSSRTIGGGLCVDVRAPERRRRTPQRMAVLAALAMPEPVTALRALLDGPMASVDLGAFARDRAIPSAMISLASLDGTVTLETAEGRHLMSHAVWQQISTSIGTQLDTVHKERPDLPGLPRERLRAGLPLRLSVSVFNGVLGRLAVEKAVALDRSWVRRPSHQVRFSEQEEQLWRHIWPRLIREPFKPPRVRDIAKAMDIDETLVRRLAKMAMRRGDVEEIAQDHFFARSVVEQMAAIARQCAEDAGAGQFTASQFRDRLDNGRKVAIQILEFFDRHGLTIRQKDLRRINPHRADLFKSAPVTTDADNGGVPLPVGRPDFKSGWGRQTASGGFDSHPPPPPHSTNRSNP